MWLIIQFALPGPSDNLGFPAWSSNIYLRLASIFILSPTDWDVLIPIEFLSKAELGEISSLSKLVNENLVFPFSPLVEKETVFEKVVPPL